MATDFRDPLGHAAQHRLGGLTIRGVQVGDTLRYFDNSQLGAWEVGVLKFARMPSAVSGRIESHQTGRVINEPPPSAGSEPVFTIV